MSDSNSYVIWFIDNKYTYSWGESEQDALTKYLKNWAAGIKAVVSSNDYMNALPPHQYIPCQKNASWDEHDPIPGTPLYDLGKPEPQVPDYAERVSANALDEQLQDTKVRLANSEAMVASLLVDIDVLRKEFERYKLNMGKTPMTRALAGE